MRFFRSYTTIVLGAVATLIATPISGNGAGADIFTTAEPISLSAANITAKNIIETDESSPQITKALDSTAINIVLAGEPELKITEITPPKPVQVATASPQIERTKRPKPPAKNSTHSSAPETKVVKEASLTIDKIKRIDPLTGIAPKSPRIGNIAGTAEIRFEDTRRIRLWGEVYYAILAQTNEMKHCVNRTSKCQDALLRGWADKIRPLKALSKKEQIERINILVNQRGYQMDSARYQRVDYWAPPSDFLKSRGDCEDYAILKFASLMALGHSNSDMRLVVGRIIGMGGHAFLSINVNGSEILLDNRTNYITKAAERTDFKPSHSMNFSHRWVHLPSQRSSKNKVRSI